MYIHTNIIVPLYKDKASANGPKLSNSLNNNLGLNNVK